MMKSTIKMFIISKCNNICSLMKAIDRYVCFLKLHIIKLKFLLHAISVIVF